MDGLPSSGRSLTCGSTMSRGFAGICTPRAPATDIASATACSSRSNACLLSSTAPIEARARHDTAEKLASMTTHIECRRPPPRLSGGTVARHAVARIQRAGAPRVRPEALRMRTKPDCIRRGPAAAAGLHDDHHLQTAGPGRQRREWKSSLDAVSAGQQQRVGCARAAKRGRAPQGHRAATGTITASAAPSSRASSPASLRSAPEIAKPGSRAQSRGSQGSEIRPRDPAHTHVPRRCEFPQDDLRRTPPGGVAMMNSSNLFVDPENTMERLIFSCCSFFVHMRAGRNKTASRDSNHSHGFRGGNVNELLSGLISQRLKESGAQPVVRKNRAGAGGNIGAEVVAKGAPGRLNAALRDQHSQHDPFLVKGACRSTCRRTSRRCDDCHHSVNRGRGTTAFRCAASGSSSRMQKGRIPGKLFVRLRGHQGRPNLGHRSLQPWRRRPGRSRTRGRPQRRSPLHPGRASCTSGSHQCRNALREGSGKSCAKKLRLGEPPALGGSTENCLHRIGGNGGCPATRFRPGTLFTRAGGNASRESCRQLSTGARCGVFQAAGNEGPADAARRRDHHEERRGAAQRNRRGPCQVAQGRRGRGHPARVVFSLFLTFREAIRLDEARLLSTGMKRAYVYTPETAKDPFLNDGTPPPTGPAAVFRRLGRSRTSLRGSAFGSQKLQRAGDGRQALRGAEPGDAGLHLSCRL